ncbi:MAG TPA: LysM peptidoglycan-binding domain-containing protein, partial [Thermoanaerobaculia bacterium]|nr:LysM peptidoglycan-binding domain-containing protein [Thermoanaerobaculia bacterium]
MVSVRRAVPVLLLVMALPAFGANAKKASSSRPPRDLHRVGDHWTPYNAPDPSSYAPTAKTYQIKRGDTLWALAKQFYGNPYLWPQLWESNTWITDAHWIYPGDTILVEGETTPVAAETAVPAGGTTTSTGATGPAQTAAGGESAPPGGSSEGGTTAPGVITGNPVPLGTEADVYCFGYLGAVNEPLPNSIDAYEDIELKYQVGVSTQANSVERGENIFIAGGTSTGIMPGETYLVVQPAEIIRHPVTKKVVGQHYDYVGQVRILCGDDRSSRAIVTQACREIRVGARLKPMPQIPIPLARVPSLPDVCDPASGKASGFIVNSQEWDLALGDGNLVEITLGREDQIQPGDFLVV